MIQINSIDRVKLNTNIHTNIYNYDNSNINI
jgi:hypothetical protein